jgi:hypothetical protein
MNRVARRERAAQRAVADRRAAQPRSARQRGPRQNGYSLGRRLHVRDRGVVEMSSALPESVILDVHEAAVSSGLGSCRGALLGGIDRDFVGMLPTFSRPAAQMLSDLHEMNGAVLADGSAPIRAWLANAIALTRGKKACAIFVRALAGAEGRPALSSATTRPRGSVPRLPIPWEPWSRLKNWRKTTIDLTLSLDDGYHALLHAGDALTPKYRIVTATAMKLMWEERVFGFLSLGKGSMRVTVELSPRPDGGTRLHFILNEWGLLLGVLSNAWDDALYLFIDPLSAFIIPPERRAEEAARTLLAALGARGIAVPDAVRERILAQKDPSLLARWLARATVATSLAEVFDEPN